jgi:predicted HTH domain antitoxin
LGELVRDAVETAYPKDIVGRRRTVALAAYQEGLVSLGKLADTIGLDPVSTRTYCTAHGVSLQTQDVSEVVTDAANA